MGPIFMSMASTGPRKMQLIPITLVLTILLLYGLCHGLLALAADDDATDLRNKYLSLTQQLNNNQFQRQLYLESVESSSTIKGDIYAMVDYPYATVNSALNDPTLGPANWCDVLILHVNTKYCHASTNSNGSMISMNIGKKVEQNLADTYLLQFDYSVAATSPQYFQVDLSADTGPLGTKDYHIVLEALAIKGNHTFLHLTYAYSYGMTGRMAMQTYLATLGLGKVGFTSTSAPYSAKQHSAKTEYIGGMRGMVERNTMRYYLAIELTSVRYPMRLTNVCSSA